VTMFGPYAKACNGPRLHEELVTAGVAVESVWTSTNSVLVGAADGSSSSGIQTVVNNHNAATLSTNQQQAQDDNGFLTTFRTNMQAVWDRMTQLETLSTTATTTQIVQAIRDEATAIKRMVRALDVIVRR
jgi:hypothetical protein